ncbi:MAG: hypothetical protein JW990_02345 [Thermoleophilia bacterium]|nr:hypothetical protein [Thermoleophilia bacterium]
MIAMVFAGIFVVLGVSLFWLVSAQSRSTEMERSDLKSFNVAEAGVDAGMLALKLGWPRSSSMAFTDMTADNALLKTSIQSGTDGMWDPARSDATEFIQVSLYDNVDSSGNTTRVANPSAPNWDSNGDEIMFVDARSNVADTRHRILIMAQREAWGLDFDAYAIVTDTIDSNGTGFDIGLDDADGDVYYDVNSATGKGIDDVDPGISPSINPIDFDDVVTEALQMKLLMIAQSTSSYFEGSGAGADASAFLNSGDANGKVVYVKNSDAVVLSGNVGIGTYDQPVVLVIDTPAGSENDLDIRGTDDFYGIVLVLGGATLKGTCSIHGSVYVSGTLTNKGTGSSNEVYYSDRVRKAINRQYTLAVKLVPNSWEEYTIASE